MSLARISPELAKLLSTYFSAEAPELAYILPTDLEEHKDQEYAHQMRTEFLALTKLKGLSLREFEEVTNNRTFEDEDDLYSFFDATVARAGWESS